ncbi:MAG: hypothetical protein C4325_01060 [Blastocatellia bacterium]
MSFAKKSFSALGKLLAAGVLVLAFTGGLVAVVYFSLSGKEVTVPDITGKDFFESEHELAALGLKIKRRAERVSEAKMNTVLEQLPKAGETVKTGQMILVVVSKAPAPGEAAPPPLKKDINQDDTEKIKEMISDKPRKPRPVANTNSNANSNTRKADTTRDIISNANTAPGAANLASPSNSETKKTPSDDNQSIGRDRSDKPDKNEKREVPPTKPSASPSTTRPPARKEN